MIIDEKEIYNKILEAKKRYSFSNCYSLSFIKDIVDFWDSENGLLISYEDHGIKRLLFFTENIDGLEKLLKYPDGGKFFVDIIGKDPNYNISGVNVIAIMKRMVNKDCTTVLGNSILTQYKDDDIGEFALLEDVQEIHQMLWTVFKTEVSHLLNEEELVDCINKKQITIHKTNGIDALLQVDVKPKNFYINQIINKTDKRIIHAMLLNRLQSYINNGGKYMYAWVEDDNIASIEFHEKYGMTHDGTWNIVYCLDV